MKKLMNVFWEGIPPKSTFQQRDKNFHPTASYRLASAQWRAILEKFRPACPMIGALSLKLILIWPHTRESAKLGEQVPKVTRPDGVNILKGVEDIMTDLGFWEDDNQLAFEAVERWHGDYPGVAIIVEAVND